MKVDSQKLGMGQIRAGSDMAEMARLPLLPLLGRPEPSPGLASDLGFFKLHFCGNLKSRGWAFSQPSFLAGI